MAMPIRPLLLLLTALLVLAGCATAGGEGYEDCRNALQDGYADLERAKAKGVGDAGDLVKAAGLLTAANAQRTFSNYPSCLEKVERARLLLRPMLN